MEGPSVVTMACSEEQLYRSVQITPSADFPSRLLLQSLFSVLVTSQPLLKYAGSALLFARDTSASSSPDCYSGGFQQ